MDNPETISINDSPSVEPQVPLRPWVAPTFQYVALKDALAGGTSYAQEDNPNLSS